MRVLVACEFSGTVRDAFRERGHDAWSCDILPCEGDSRYHLQSDVFRILDIYPGHYDLMIAHPPCTFLANSSNKHLYNGMKKENGPNITRWHDMLAGAHFFWRLMQARIDRICIENPIMHGYAKTYVGKQQLHALWYSLLER